MMLAISVVSGLLPSFILLGYFYAHDVNREPGKAILTTYALGIVILVPVAILELTAFGEFHAFNHPFLAGLIKAFWGAAVPEELLKFLVVVGYCARLRTFDERMDGMVYGAVASLGFAAMENVLYVAQANLSLAVTRAVTAVPCHAFLGAIMGYYVGQGRFDSKRRGRWQATGLGLVILLHGLYDFPLLTIKEMRLNKTALSGTEVLVVVSLSTMAMGVLLLEGYLAVSLVRRLRATQLYFKGRLESLVKEHR
jgi:RsiW-degrading membrane proteinase PrsW (M82 family)